MTSPPIDVSDLAATVPAATREAALLYANGDVAGARDALEGALARDSGTRRDWLMLMDLERLQGRWRAYETLVARYRMRFSEDPPTERERKQREMAMPEELRAGGSGCVSLGSELNGAAMPTMVAIREAATRHTVIHLDVGRVEVVDPVGARFLVSALTDLVAAGNGVVVTGGDHLARGLRRLVSDQPAQLALWDLLLLLRRLLQDREGFERDAVDLALATHGNPPGWEPLIMPQPLRVDTSERRSEPRYVTRESLALEGVIEHANDLQLEAVAEFAAVNEYVNLQLPALERLSLSAAHVLARAVESAAAQGRTVRLIRPNQLVAALLEVLNLGQSAAILHAKPSSSGPP